MKAAYLSLCAVGTVLPYWQFWPFLREHGLDVPAMIEQVFATPAGAFFGMDVIVSAVVLWLFVMSEGRRRRVRHLWAPIVATLTVGVSLGLPLCLYLREAASEPKDA